MPILKTEILGIKINLNYQEKEKEKLLAIIENFKKRLLEFKNLEGKVSNVNIIFLAALKAEDQLLSNNSVSEIVKLKDKVNSLNQINDNLINDNSLALNELEKIEKKFDLLFNKNINKNNENN